MTTAARWLPIGLLLTCSCASTASSDPTAVAPSEVAPPTAPPSPPSTEPSASAMSRPMSPKPAEPAVDPSALHAPTEAERAAYGWLDGSASVRNLSAAFPTPKGFTRVPEASGSFGAWLRDLPLRAVGTPVRSYAGGVLREGDDARISAVAELDVGTADLQQCADSVIRLHAEWRWSRGDASKIGYHFLSGDLAAWTRYASGDRPVADGAKVVWKRSAKPSESRATFRRYLDVVFNYASTISLAQHTAHVERGELAPGDFFILPGGPGHAVLVLDVATSADGRKIALLGQGYMPAQDFQVLHPLEGATGAWFTLDGDAVDTPFWEPFPWSALHRLEGVAP